MSQIRGEKNDESLCQVPPLEQQEKVVHDYIQEIEQVASPGTYRKQDPSHTTATRHESIKRVTPKERDWKTTTIVSTPQRQPIITTKPSPINERDNHVLSVGMWKSTPKPKSSFASASSFILDADKKKQATITPDQKARIEENRKHALELQAAAAGRNKKAKTATQTVANCVRCGSTNPKTLCVVWFHDGDAQRMYDGFARRDYFIMDCCGRSLPQPCFIGNHSFDPNDHHSSSIWRSLVLHCRCNKLAKLRRTHKEGQNTGRYFFSCGEEIRRCNFFKWADEVYGLDATDCTPRLAPDGIKEWLYPQANPFSEPDLLQQSHTTKEQSRKRLLAALIIRQMIHMVAVGPLVQTSCTVHQLFEDIKKKLKNEQDIIKGLWPLKPSQIEHRLGPLSSLQDPTPDEEELEAALYRALKENQVLLSTVQYCKLKNRTDPEKEDIRWLNMNGLENYVSV